MEKVVVLLSTYNGEKYIREQVDSLLAQTYENFEIIVRDDGSTDSTLKILDEYRKSGSLMYYMGTNIGPAYSFIDLIKKAPIADYYALCDQDDVWNKEKISICIENMKNCEQPTMLYHAMDVVDEYLQTIGHYFREEKYSQSLM